MAVVVNEVEVVPAERAAEKAEQAQGGGGEQSPPSEHDGHAGGMYLSFRRNFSPIMYWLLVPFVATSAIRVWLRR